MQLDDNTASYVTGAVVGGIVTFLQENWSALFIVPLIAGLVGMIGKEIGKFLINKIKEYSNRVRTKKNKEHENNK